MRTIDTMMGKCYPFFLENSVLSNSPYYLYELYSPCLSDKGVPTFSMRKLSEKVLDVHPKTGEYLYPIGKESDLLYYVANTKKVKKTFLEYMKGVYRNPEVFVSEYCGKSGFPITELNLSDNFNTLQRQLVISLRDSLRWKSYKFAPGRQVDLLYSPTEFVVCEFVLSDSDTIKLVPKAVYKNSDVEMKYPLKVDLTKIILPRDNETGWNKEKFSEINISLKFYEWDSFGRKELVKLMTPKRKKN